MRISRLILAVAGFAFLCTPAFAQRELELNRAIADFDVSALNDCIPAQEEKDLGAILNLSNPLMVMGSIIFYDLNLRNESVLMREPLALPIEVTAAADPNNFTCDLELEATTSATLMVLGNGVAASRGDVLRIRTRLIATQSLSTVAESDTTVSVWRSTQYAPQFRQVLSSRQDDNTNFWLVDNVSIYLVEVERYRRIRGNLKGGIGIVRGDITYERNDSFRGTRLVVTGDSIRLRPAWYQDAPAPAVVHAQPSDPIATLSPQGAAALNASLAAIALPEM